MNGFSNEMCVLKTADFSAVCHLHFKCFSEAEPGPLYCSGPFPSSSLALGQSAQVRRGALPERGALLALFL